MKFSIPPKLIIRRKGVRISIAPIMTPIIFKVSPITAFLEKVLLLPLESIAKIRPSEPKINEVPKQLVTIETIPKAREANAMETEPCSGVLAGEL